MYIIYSGRVRVIYDSRMGASPTTICEIDRTSIHASNPAYFGEIGILEPDLVRMYKDDIPICVILPSEYKPCKHTLGVNTPMQRLTLRFSL